MNILIEQASRYGAVTQEETDLASCLSTLESMGYSVSDALALFLRAHNGIQGHHAPYRNHSGAARCFYIDPQKAVREVYREQVEQYETVTGCSLVPVGECDNGHLILMHGNGVLYGVFDDRVYRYGTTLAESLDVLIHGKDAVELPAR